MTWRIHSDVRRFISEVAYESRLELAPQCSNQGVGGEGDLDGTGLRYRPVVLRGNRTSSIEGAGAVADLFNDLVGRPWTRSQWKGTQPDDRRHPSRRTVQFT